MNSHQYLQQVKEKLQELAEETDRVKKSAQFQEYLDTMARFWDYSYHNQLLIYFALPTATRVAGFKSWQELGRNVKKGSKAIKILAPYLKKAKEADPETLEEAEKEFTLFFPVNVFDISQTEGKELPRLDIQLEGSDYTELLKALEGFCEVKGIKLEYKNLGVNGLYGYSLGGKVVVSSKDSVNMQVNTLTHEITHELLHKKEKLPKKQQEIQAESVAYVVCKHFGLETKSFTYLALYEANSEQILENLQAIAEASREIISFLS